MSNSDFQKQLQECMELIPADVQPLVETMAKDVHDEWVAGRIRDGWSYGTQRDNELKQHPCLVEYDKLSEVEREYDRRTAMRVIEFIRSQGFRILREV